ncbi:hypothetical protein BGZ95_011132, partial [Linnemannia exigua]
MTRAILLVKIITAAIALATSSSMVLSGVESAPAAAPTPTIPVAATDSAAISGATAC